MTTTVLAFIPSPSQGVWHLGIVPIRAYALCIIVGIVAALILGDRRWVNRGGEPGVVYDLALWAVPFGLIGGRLYHVMTDWQKYFGPDGAGFLAALRIWDGGLGIWGAVALGGVGAWIACRRRGFPLPAFGDAIAPGIILAQAIGRLGNYFNQELYGRETDLPWGLTIYQRLDPSGVISPHSLDGVSTGQVYAVVHPTFLYELLWNLLIFALLLWADKRFNLGHGRLFALYVAGYCVGRFWVELMRSDTATLIAGIRVNTFTSTFVFIGAVIYIMVAAKGREDPKTLLGKDVDGSRFAGVGEELTAVAATSGVVAAAKVAGDEDETATSTENTSKPSGESTAPPEDGLLSVDGDEVAAAQDDAAEVHAAAVEGTESASANAEGVATETGETEFTGGADVESEAAAESVDLIEQVETASSEDIATGEAFAAEGEAADESTAPPEDGLLSVDGDEVAAAQDDAADVHDAAVEGTETATATAGDVAAEGEAADESTAPPEDGLLSVDGDEVAAAQDDAADVHDAAVEGTATATATADNVAAEGEAADESTAPPEDGLLSVDGDEVAAAQDDAAEVHGAAVQGTKIATATAEGVASEAAETDESTAPPEDGLLSIDGDEVAAAQDDAAEVHDAAVEGTESATLTADDVASEKAETGETEFTGGADVESEAAAESVDLTEQVETASSEDIATGEAFAAEGEAADESTAPPEDGLLSVDGDEVAAAQDDAAEVHDASVQGTESASATADDVADEDPAEKSTAPPEDGLLSVDGDEVAAAQDDAAEVHDAAVQGTESATATADDVADEDPADDTPTDSPARPYVSPRRRWWRRG